MSLADVMRGGLRPWGLGAEGVGAEGVDLKVPGTHNFYFFLSADYNSTLMGVVVVVVVVVRIFTMG